MYSPNNAAVAKWRSGLQPLSVYQQCQLEKTVRDYTKLLSVHHSPPQITLSVRWHNHGELPCYSRESLFKIFSHFGAVRKISFQSQCSAHVVFENIESACAALSLSNLGFPSCPLHVRWLPETTRKLLWRRRDATPKVSPTRNAGIERNDAKSEKKACNTRAPGLKSPQALTRPSQISCTVYIKKN